MPSIDLPFALPTAVAGISLAAIYAPNGWIGALLAPLGIKIAYTPAAASCVALIFVGLPFVVRTVQPVLAEIEKEIEEAAALLGASRLRTVFPSCCRSLTARLLTGFALAFARGIGEYGSVIFIAGNLPFVSEIAPLLIVIRLEEFDYARRRGDRGVMLGSPSSSLLIVNLHSGRNRRRLGYGPDIARPPPRRAPPRHRRAALVRFAPDRASPSRSCFCSCAAAGRGLRRGFRRGLGAYSQAISPIPTRSPPSG